SSKEQPGGSRTTGETMAGEKAEGEQAAGEGRAAGEAGGAGEGGEDDGSRKGQKNYSGKTMSPAGTSKNPSQGTSETRGKRPRQSQSRSESPTLLLPASSLWMHSPSHLPHIRSPVKAAAAAAAGAAVSGIHHAGVHCSARLHVQTSPCRLSGIAGIQSPSRLLGFHSPSHLVRIQSPALLARSPTRFGALGAFYSHMHSPGIGGVHSPALGLVPFRFRTSPRGSAPLYIPKWYTTICLVLWEIIIVLRD
ncbi:unnamed protein product, partial [Closterium sp. NIES-54]